MKNKKAVLIILAAVLLVAVLVGIIIAATSCQKGPQRLASPKNVRMEGTVLFWDAVENATEYVVRFENEERRTARLQYGLAFLTEPKTYTIAVYAAGDGEAYLNSDPVEISYTVKNGGTNISNKEDIFYNKQPTEGLTYTLLEDSTGYTVSGDKNTAGVVVIPEQYEGLPVKKVGKFGTNSMNSSSLETLPALKLTAVYIPDTVEEIEAGAFYKCVNLTEIRLSNALKIIGELAFHDTALSEVILPDSITTIGEMAFYGCTSLEKIRWPKNLESLGSEALKDTAWLRAKPDGLVIAKNILIGYKGEPKDAALVIPDGVTVIGGNAFKELAITSVTIPDGVKTIGKGAFTGCTALSEIELPETVEEIGNFAFEKTALTSVSLPASLKRLRSYAFSGCASLTEVVCNSDFVLENDCFRNCISLRAFQIPKGVTEIPKTCFYGCSALSSVTIPEGVITIRDGAFCGCTSLEEIVLPSTLKSIRSSAFGSTGLKRIVIREGVTDINSNAFTNCNALKEIVFPASALPCVKMLNSMKVNKVYFTSTAKVWNNGVPGGYTLPASITLYFYVEDESILPNDGGNYWHYGTYGEIVIW